MGADFRDLLFLLEKSPGCKCISMAQHLRKHLPGLHSSICKLKDIDGRPILVKTEFSSYKRYDHRVGGELLTITGTRGSTAAMRTLVLHRYGALTPIGEDERNIEAAKAQIEDDLDLLEYGAELASREKEEA